MHTSNIEHEWFVPGKLLWASPMRGVEVTELGDGGAYFAPPGDFSKVDFSACRELGESVNFDAEHNELPRRDLVTIRMTYGDKFCPETSMQAAEAIRARVIGRVGKTVRYVIVNEYSSPKTAQHSKQAKPALPSLMTEAGERYQGLGWCDE